MDKEKIKKLKKYINDDRPSKLKSYLKKHRLSKELAGIELSGGRSLLHYCCQHSSSIILRLLLKDGVNPVEPDNDGNLPLHIALQRALDADTRVEAKEVYTELILPLIEAAPQSLEEKNYKRVSCRQLMEKVLQENSQESDESETEQDWNEKLAEEAGHDQGDYFGRYGTSQDFWEEKSKESYDHWADRMTSDYRCKQRHKYGTTNNTRTPKKDKQPPKRSSVVDEEELRRIREGLKRKYEETQKRTVKNHKLRRKNIYEQNFSSLLKSKHGDLTFEDIPWPSRGSSLDVMDVIFSEFKERTGTQFKKYLKDQQVRWHPDKFTQKLGKRLIEGEREKIMDRVKEISQALNKISESLPS